MFDHKTLQTRHVELCARAFPQSLLRNFLKLTLMLASPKLLYKTSLEVAIDYVSEARDGCRDNNGLSAVCDAWAAWVHVARSPGVVVQVCLNCKFSYLKHFLCQLSYMAIGLEIIVFTIVINTRYILLG